MVAEPNFTAKWDRRRTSRDALGLQSCWWQKLLLFNSEHGNAVWAWYVGTQGLPESLSIWIPPSDGHFSPKLFRGNSNAPQPDYSPTAPRPGLSHNWSQRNSNLGPLCEGVRGVEPGY